MTFVLCALLAQAPLAEERRDVVRVELRLPVGVDEKLLERINELVMVRKGQKLSRRLVRRSIESLFESRRFSDVVARVEDEGAGVAVVFELFPKRIVAEVFFEGPRRLIESFKPELLAAGRLQKGGEYWPERGEQGAEAMAELLRRRGFGGAEVSHQAIESELGLSIGFTVSPGAPTLIQSVTFAGDPGLSVDRLLEAMELSTGQVLDLDVAQQGVDRLRALFRRERYWRSRVEAPVVFDGGRLVIPVQAGPRFELTFVGNRRFTDSTLTAVLAYDGEETLDGQLASRLATRLNRFYRSRGFHDVQVRVSSAKTKDERRAALAFEIEEGNPVRVERVFFEGNRALAEPELRDVLARVIESAAPVGAINAHATGDPLSLEGRMASVFGRDFPNPPAITVLDEDAYAEGLKAITVLYRERGYLQAHAELVSIERSGDRAYSRIKIVEGPEARFRLIQSQGFPKGFRSDALELFKTNSIFSASTLETLRQAVLRELSRRGYYYAEATATFKLDPTGHFVDCLIDTTPGPRVRVRTILAVGAERTDSELILRQATMTEGQALDSESLYTTQSNLLATGAFRTAEVELLAPERAEPLKTVILKLKERARVLEGGVGYFVADGPRVVLDAEVPNLGGRAVNLSVRGQLNYFGLSVPARTGLVDVSNLDPFVTETLPEFFSKFPLLLAGRGNVSIQNRGLLPLDIGWRLDAVGERVFRPQFRFTRFAAVPTLDWTRSFEIPRIENRLKMTLALQGELEWARVQETSLRTTSPLTFVDQERLRFLFGTFGLYSLRFQPTFDLRDSALTPRKGVLLQVSAEVTGKIYAGTPIAPGSDVEREVNVSFFKTSAVLTGYLPLSQRTVLALSLRGGRIVPLAGDSVTPPVKRFFLGGSTSMRGFNEDQLIAEDRRAQYREQVAACQVLAVKEGCTTAAATVAAGRQIPSEGGEFYGLAKAEVRFPGFSVFDFGLFFEAGNLWLAMPTDFSRLRTVLGAGVRYNTPIGPLAFDLGWNLNPDRVINEPYVVLHFNIGVF